MKDKEEFLKAVDVIAQGNEPFKIVISKPRSKSTSLVRVYIKPISLSDARMINIVTRNKTNDVTKNIPPSALKNYLEENLADHFYNLDIATPSQNITVLQSKKGKFTILVKNQENDLSLENHNREKNRLVTESEEFLKILGLSTPNGKIHAKHQDKYRQINKFLEIIESLINDEEKSLDIVDMGSGKGYLTFATYMHLSTKTDLRMTGVELRKDLVDKCNRAAKSLGWRNLFFVEGNIDSVVQQNMDMVIALHACDIATDMAIAKGINSGAKYIVVSPCCHKQIRKEMSTKGSSIDTILRHGIFLERQAEMITDAIRAMIMESRGYEVKVFEFISSEHTAKNIIITAIKNGATSNDALEEVEKLKREFGINKHYLEDLI